MQVAGRVKKVSAEPMAAELLRKTRGDASHRQAAGVGVDFIEAGRILQRFWLTATSLGLSFQPVSVGLLYLGQQIQLEAPDKLTSTQVKFAKEAYKNVIDIFNISISQKIPVFSFRIGYTSPPTARSLKKEPMIENYE